jgi:hypothetical protein
MVAVFASIAFANLIVIFFFDRYRRMKSRSETAGP